MTMTTNTFLDERALTLVRSPSGLAHIEGWFGETLCRKWINYGYNAWSYMYLTSVRECGRIAQKNVHGYWCKSCFREYKDVIIDG